MHGYNGGAEGALKVTLVAPKLLNQHRKVWPCYLWWRTLAVWQPAVAVKLEEESRGEEVGKEGIEVEITVIVSPGRLCNHYRGHLHRAAETTQHSTPTGCCY